MIEDCSYIKKCEVLVQCMTYNHSKYITDALNGFAMQKTNFPFVCLVMDDASTDGGQEVIKDFLNRECLMDKAEYYDHELADIVIVGHKTNQNCTFAVYFLKVNLYNTNKKEPLINEWCSKSEYIALCEGDDYWIDPFKLQKQVEYMDTHPECSLCFTNGDCYKNGIFLRKVIPNCKENKPYYKPGDYDYSFEEMLGLDYVPTASLMFRAETIKSIPALPPDYFSGDAYIRLYATSQGYSHNIDDVTCVYNLGVDSSSTTQWIENADSYKRFNIAFVKMLKKLDELTAFKYHTCLDNAICEKSIRLFKNENDWKGLYSPRIRRYMSKKPMPEKLRYYLFPFTKQVRLLFRL